MLEKITDSIIYIGANDHDIDMFEGQYDVPDGMAYNSYVIFMSITSLCLTPMISEKLPSMSSWVWAQLREILMNMKRMSLKFLLL